MKRKFSIVDEEYIRDGLTTDVYFIRTEEVLKEKKINPHVVADVTVGSIDGGWGILSGVEEVADLLEGKPIDVHAMEEGTLFYPKEPVMRIEGKYLDFTRYETPILGFLCHNSGIVTKAARIKLAAGDASVISFGSRRQHPALAVVIERCAYMGGMDGISNFAAGKIIGVEASGTMPHSLIICFGDQKEAFKAFDEVISEDVKRVCLCDTYSDEKMEAIMAWEAIGDSLDSIRLDTPSSRRGDFKRMIEEVRWELDIRGGERVKIFVSGGIDEGDIAELKGIVNGFGVGTSVSNARAINFALDIVEKGGRPCAKRGKFGGKKEVYRSLNKLKDEIRLEKEEKPDGMEPLLLPVIKNGKIVMDFSLKEARERVMDQLEILRRMNSKADKNPSKAP
jgi:nicotinate phosphoribosyltransferase